MKKAQGIFLSMFLFIVSAAAMAADEKKITADMILEKMDDVVNAPKDQSFKMKLVLIDKDENEKSREMEMIQKGSEKRMGKFLSPADQAGIAFLSLPGDIMYLYLPAFKKTRRIASHVKNKNFAGTDFTYEDMETRRYSEKWNPELVKTTKEYYVLKLEPKKETRTEHLKIVVTVRKDNFYPVKIEFYNKRDELSKIMTSDKIEKVNGYWVSKESTMENLKSLHKTKMIITEVKFDLGLKDNEFTKRYLSR